MSENTDVNQSDSGSAGAAPRRSRRAMREAERAAEREAILTGQQPLLTRREMRRLREEAEALQQALAAGEITPEQARALQDPLADQPVIDAPAHEAVGHHAAATTPTGGVPAAHTTSPTPATAETPAEPAAEAPAAVRPDVPPRGSAFGGTESAWGETAASEPTPAHPLRDESASAAPQSARPEALPEVEAIPSFGIPEWAPSVPELPVANADAPAVEAPTASSPQVADAGLTEAQMEEISSLPTGVLEAVDAPLVSSTSLPPSPAPTRRSLRRRIDADGSEQSPDEPAQLEQPGAPRTEAAFVSADSADVDEVSSRDAAAPADSGQEPEQVGPAALPRRPIVRIPSAAQGVRTVDSDTGELSSVQPVIQPDAALQVSQPQPVPDADDVDEPAAADAERAMGATAETDVAAEADTAVETEAAVETDAEVYSGIDNPQWRSLTDVDSAATKTSGRADQGRAGGSYAGSSTAAGAEVTGEPTEAASRSEGGSRAGRTLLIVLLAVVLALVVLAVVWFLLNNGIIGSLPQVLEGWTPLLV